MILSGDSEGNLFCAFLLRSDGCRHPRLPWRRAASLCLCLHKAFSLEVWVSNLPCLSLIRSPLTGFGAHPKSSMISSPAPSLSYICNNPFSPNKVTVAGLGRTCLLEGPRFNLFTLQDFALLPPPLWSAPCRPLAGRRWSSSELLTFIGLCLLIFGTGMTVTSTYSIVLIKRSIKTWKLPGHTKSSVSAAVIIFLAVVVTLPTILQVP